MLLIKELREDIRLGFAYLQAYISLGGNMNLTDINVHAEDFVGVVLNALNSWTLVNTNKIAPNYPCIDLLEAHKHIGIQVTSQAGAKKLNETISCIRNHKMSGKINQLKVFSVIKKQRSYAINESCPGVSFNWQQDVLDFDTLLQQINAVSDLRHLRAIHSVVTNALPAPFASRRATLLASRDRLEKDLVIFDRQVMSAPAYVEDPVLMYKALREMRIALQINGSSRVSNVVAARNFDSAKSIIADAEHTIRRQYPYIHEAAMNDAQNVQYPDGAFSESISLMMETRGKLQPLLEEVERELEAINAQL